jgi:hypothetical protein
VGLVSRGRYRAGDTFIERLETPYGTTRFATGEEGTARWVEITNPLGHTERVEVRDDTPGIAARELESPFGCIAAYSISSRCRNNPTSSRKGSLSLRSVPY